jgi:hypothetical protein
MKFLDDILLEQTGSTPEVPSDNNFGVLYASASKLHFRTTIDNVTLGYPNSRINILYFTGSNQGDGTTRTYTYTVPNNIQIIDIVCIGAGGGGGSGYRSSVAAINTAGVRSGGYGGAGGSMVRVSFHVSELVPGSNYTVTVPPGGAGGAPQTTLNIRGNSGQDGGSTSFGNRVIATGGQGGIGGQGGTAAQNRATSSITNCTPAGGQFAMGSSGAGRIQNTGASTANALEMMSGFLNIVLNQGYGAAAGGGAGGGHGNVANTPQIASSGSSGYDLNGSIVNNNLGTPGISTISGPGGNGGNGNDKLLTTFFNNNSSIDLDLQYGLGGGGHGGGYPTGSGGVGGLYGAGGGGGGAAFSAIPASGRGGSGSSGLCVVIEYL